VIPESSQFEDESSFSAITGVAFGQLIARLDHVAIASHTLDLVHEFMKSPRWEMAYAGLKALRRLMPDCCDVLSGWMDEIIHCLIVHFRHPHYFVRHQAYLATARYLQLSDFTMRYYDPVLQAVMGLLDQEDLGIVKTAALVTLSVIFRNLPKEVVEPLTEPVATRIFAEIENPDTGVQAQSIRTLSSLSYSAPQAMAQFYPVFIEMLKRVHQLQVTESNSVLLSRAVEGVSHCCNLVPEEIFAVHLPYFLTVWMGWDWTNLFGDMNSHLIECLSNLTTKFPDFLMVSITEFIQKIKILIAFKPVPVQYEPYHQEIPFRHDKLIFAGSDNMYFEYSLPDLQRVQFTLELLDKVIKLAAPEGCQMFIPFTQRLVKCMHWTFYAKIQAAAAHCLFDLVEIVLTNGQDPRFVFNLFQMIQYIFEKNGEVLSPLAQYSFLEILRSLLALQIEAGIFEPDSIPALLDAFPHIMECIWGTRLNIPQDEGIAPELMEEQLALMVILLCDQFPDTMMPMMPLADLCPGPEGPFFMLVCAEYVSVTHEMHPSFENSLLLAVSNGLGHEVADVVRVSCSALMMIIDNIVLDAEFIQEILACITITLSSPGITKSTVDALLILFSRLMQVVPDIALKREHLELWFSYLPVVTQLEKSELVYQFLVFVLHQTELLDRNEDFVVKLIDIVREVMRAKLADDESQTALREYIAELLQNEAISGFIEGQDDAFKEKLHMILSAE
jgi:hypothetical protein